MLLCIGAGGSLVAGPELFQGRGIGAGPAIQAGARAFASIFNLAMVADRRLFCTLFTSGDPPLFHDDTHAEIKAYKQLTEAFLADVAGPEHRAAIQALAHVGANMTEFARLYPDRMLDSLDGSVRIAAADAIALSFGDDTRDPIYGPRVLPLWDHVAYAAIAHELIDRRVRQEPIALVTATLLRTAAELPMDATRLSQVQELLGRHLTGDPQGIHGALSGFEILTRRTPGRGFGVDLSRRFRSLATGDLMQITLPRGGAVNVKELLASIRRLSLLVLHQSNADSEDTLIRVIQDEDWQVRRLAATYVTVDDPTVAAIVASRLGDQAFQVRAAAITALGPWMRSAHECAALFDALEDTNPGVVMAAIDAAPAGCQEHDRLIAWLRARAESLSGDMDGQWHVPMRALMALVRFGDPRVGALVLAAAKCNAWAAREQTADLAATLKDEPTALALAKDSDADETGRALVRAAGLRALTRLGAGARMTIALDALRPVESRPIPGPLVLAALAALPESTPAVTLAQRLDEALAVRNRSRTAALALIHRYEKLDVGESQVLRRLTRDGDPVIAQAAAIALSTITHQRVAAEPQLSGPSQVAYAGMSRAIAPPLATVTLSTGGSFRMQLYNNDAAVSVWWARGAATSPSSLFGTFFDVAPGVGAQSSPFANAIDGVTLLRDELNEIPHLRGSVALMSDGHDLANGRLFIDLIDRPDLNHAYTVIGRIVSGLDVADSILPGARVKSVVFSER